MFCFYFNSHLLLTKPSRYRHVFNYSEVIKYTLNAYKTCINGAM